MLKSNLFDCLHPVMSSRPEIVRALTNNVAFSTTQMFVTMNMYMYSWYLSCVWSEIYTAS